MQSDFHLLEVVAAAFGAAGTVAVPVILYFASSRKSAKQDTERRHQENQQLLSQLVTDRKYYPPHSHVEKSGALQVDGISYSPINGKN